MRRRKDTWTRTAPAEIPEWYDHAACRGSDPDIFFPETLSQGRPRDDASDDAKAICNMCDVKDICLDYALALSNADDPYGVWGGMTPKERRAARRQRRAA